MQGWGCQKLLLRFVINGRFGATVPGPHGFHSWPVLVWALLRKAWEYVTHLAWWCTFALFFWQGYWSVCGHSHSLSSATASHVCVSELSIQPEAQVDQQNVWFCPLLHSFTNSLFLTWSFPLSHYHGGTETLWVQLSWGTTKEFTWPCKRSALLLGTELGSRNRMNRWIVIWILCVYEKEKMTLLPLCVCRPKPKKK